jgi:hypothetical protein
MEEMTWEELPNESPDFIDLGDTLLAVPVRASFSLKNHTTNKHFRCALSCWPCCAEQHTPTMIPRWSLDKAHTDNSRVPPGLTGHDPMQASCSRWYEITLSPHARWSWYGMRGRPCRDLQ